MSELSALDDAIRTAQHMKNLGVQNISINPCYIGKKTLMEQLFYEGSYFPPWLWTVYYATIRIKQTVGPDVRVISDPVAAGSDRGPRNCGNCDKMFKAKLKEFSATQDISTIENLDCECKEVYRAVVTTEHLQHGSGARGVWV